MSITDNIFLPSWPHNIANNEANLREVSSKDFAIIKTLTTTPVSQVNNRFGKERLLLYTPFMYQHTKECLPATYPSFVANEESIPLALLRTL